MTADARPKSAIELITHVQGLLDALQKNAEGAPPEGVRTLAIRADGFLEQAVKLLRSEVDDGR